MRYIAYRVDNDVTMDAEQCVGARPVSIEHPPVHGVLADPFSHFGKLPRKLVGYDDLAQVMEEDRDELGSGDIFCLWTVLDLMIMRMQGRPNATIKEACAVLDGSADRLLQGLTDTDSGVAAIAADNQAAEAVGRPRLAVHTGTPLPVNELCLFSLGVPSRELWYLWGLETWLSQHGSSSFLLTTTPLSLTGAVGSPMTPIATV